MKARQRVTRKHARSVGPHHFTDNPDRHMPAMCCGRRMGNCTCFQKGRGAQIATSLDHTCLHSLIAGTRTSRIQTWRDTADMPQFSKQIRPMPLRRLCPIAFAWRHYSNPHFWKALQKAGAFPRGHPPAWHVWLAVMQQWKARRETIFGGLFYSGARLKWYRFDPKKPWVQVSSTTLNSMQRDILAIKIMWSIADGLRTQFNALQSCPSRHAWHACVAAMHERLQQCTNGAFGDYATKLMLDGVLLRRPDLARVVSWWPMQCKAYITVLPMLYPGLLRNQDDLWLAACHYHGRMKTVFTKMSVCETLARLCWDHRGCI